MAPELRDNHSNEAQAFAKFLSTRKVLIADPGAASRSGLFKVIQNLGGKTENLVLVNSFPQAETAIMESKPHVVIAEYALGKHCGLELLRRQREQRPQETKECLFVLITGNTSQSAVAKSAEEEIDAYILKPYTPEVVRKTILRAALLKIKPPAYYVTIDEGKALLQDWKLEEAEKKFTEAKSLDPSPSLACYYLGQVQLLKKIEKDAEGSYQQGLDYNKIHYKCLVGLYDLLIGQKNHVKAYEIVKRISQYFPANPKRLGEVLRLALLCGQYEDIEKYYAIFMNIDERDETLIRYVSAALVVCGKHYLGTGTNRARALELFAKASATAAGRINILKEIIFALVDHGLHREATPFLERVPPQAQGTDGFLLLKFLVSSGLGNREAALELGRKLVANKLSEQRLYLTMLKNLAEVSASQMAIDTVLTQAVALFPSEKDKFEGLAKAARKSAPAA